MHSLLFASQTTICAWIRPHHTLFSLLHKTGISSDVWWWYVANQEPSISLTRQWQLIEIIDKSFRYCTYCMYPSSCFIQKFKAGSGLLSLQTIFVQVTTTWLSLRLVQVLSFGLQLTPHGRRTKLWDISKQCLNYQRLYPNNNSVW